MHHGQGCKQRKDVNKASTFLSSFFFRYDFFLLQLDDKIAEDSRDILHDNISMIILHSNNNILFVIENWENG